MGLSKCEHRSVEICYDDRDNCPGCEMQDEIETLESKVEELESDDTLDNLKERIAELEAEIQSLKRDD